jgi:tungstate transport system ATP-binding protein
MNLKLENLMKEYESKRGIKCVLNIEEGVIEGGSRTAIIGANGAGKSTLLNIIAGLEPATSGGVFYEREAECFQGQNNIAALGAWTDKIPYDKLTLVFQTPYLIRTTVEKNISYPLKLRGWKTEDIEKRIYTVMHELGLLELRKQKVWQLSGGEIQKVSLARALSFRPSLLLLDEPTANIDPATTVEIERMLIKMNSEEGTTILFITHNLMQAKRVCNKVIFLDKGELVEYGDCKTVLESPNLCKTKLFIETELLI